MLWIFVDAQETLHQGQKKKNWMEARITWRNLGWHLQAGHFILGFRAACRSIALWQLDCSQCCQKLAMIQDLIRSARQINQWQLIFKHSLADFAFYVAFVCKMIGAKSSQLKPSDASFIVNARCSIGWSASMDRMLVDQMILVFFECSSNDSGVLWMFIRQHLWNFPDSQNAIHNIIFFRLLGTFALIQFDTFGPHSLSFWMLVVQALILWR